MDVFPSIILDARRYQRGRDDDDSGDAMTWEEGGGDRHLPPVATAGGIIAPPDPEPPPMSSDDDFSLEEEWVGLDDVLRVGLDAIPSLLVARVVVAFEM